VSGLREAGLGGSWVPVDNYHVTLRFFGGLTNNEAEALAAALTSGLSPASPCTLRLHGFGAFPSPRQPAVLWAGVDVVEGDLTPWFQAAENAARIAGLKPENRPPHPHVTWLRPRTRRRSNASTGPDWTTATFASDAFTARSVALWESGIGAGPARYTLVKEFPVSSVDLSPFVTVLGLYIVRLIVTKQ